MSSWSQGGCAKGVGALAPPWFRDVVCLVRGLGVRVNLVLASVTNK
eukprot:COSAG01_NODE_10688_length_2104_cov_18.637406_1_plen_46_part_00